MVYGHSWKQQSLFYEAFSDITKIVNCLAGFNEIDTEMHSEDTN